MTTTTPNYGLYLYSEIADGSGSFIQFRLDVAGDVNAAGSGSSNMQIIDGALGTIDTILSDGWIPDTDTWVYVSSTSFKIIGKDVTARFPVGTKIKLTQTTTKYFYVTNAVFSVDTTVTVNAGSDYSLVNAVITNPYYSYTTTPQGFPQWFNWTPVWTATTTNPSLGNGTLYGRSALVGKLATVMVYLAPGSTTTFGSGQWIFSLPYTVTSSITRNTGSWIALDSGTSWFAGACVVIENATSISLFLRDNVLSNGFASNVPFVWTNGDQLMFQITYEIA